MKVGHATHSSAEKFRRSEPPLRVVSGIVPRAVVRPEALSFHILRPGDAGPMDIPLLSEAYRCWSAVWRQTFNELDGAKYVPSDDFSRQDEVCAIFHDWECVGMMSHRYVNLESPIAREDSYFKVWPKECVDAACAQGTRVCIGSSLTVAAPWRSSSGVSIKDLLLTLSVDRFLETDSDTLVGTMRNNRGMNALGYRIGFRPLARDLVHHGVNVDLVVFHRQTSQRLPLEGEAEAIVQRLLPR